MMKSQVKEINKINIRVMICRKDNDWSVQESSAKTRHGKIHFFMTIYIELTNHRDNHIDQQWKQNANSIRKKGRYH